MKIEDNLKKEDQNKDKIYLYAEGIFWKAYERSAFLFFKNLKSYNVKTRFYKKVNRDVKYLGFPMSSLNKIINDNYTVNEIVPEKELSISGLVPVNMIEYEEWCTKQSVNNENTKSDCDDLMSRISHFPVLQKSPLECQNFIIQLQNEIHGTV